MELTIIILGNNNLFRLLLILKAEIKKTSCKIGNHMNKYCQGPKCHTYMTKDRKRGIKGDKYFQTRTVGRYGYGDNHFCTANLSGVIGGRNMEREPLTTSADYTSQ